MGLEIVELFNSGNVLRSRQLEQNEHESTGVAQI